MGIFTDQNGRWHTRGVLMVVGMVVALLAGFIILLMWSLPQYQVWQQGLAGEAKLKRAEQTRQILVQQATAERDAAVLRAEAIAIVGQAAKDFPEYRQQEFMGALGEALQSHSVQKIIFVPTEANIPITEAGRTNQ